MTNAANTNTDQTRDLIDIIVINGSAAEYTITKLHALRLDKTDEINELVRVADAIINFKPVEEFDEEEELDAHRDRLDVLIEAVRF